ncbi:general secretion protein H, putative [Luminiphilus syltensis NOR5-1B]|uniref:General secretion protein H, putative n=1 Tax=Luminiphilus syltensis NOR5-1B TaxID=565045 RepID=B8KWY4_9GAMM|nr:general secretion protein H, putative [Luminiphilus syltensis NOR5-1B]
MVAAITIVGLVMAVAVPQSIKFYESMQFRSSVRETITLLKSARHAAIAQGVAQDVVVEPNAKTVRFGKRTAQFEREVQLSVNSAAELNTDAAGVIRFYPDGGASGGGVDIRRENGVVISIAVDWLIGRVRLVSADAAA